MVQEYSYNGWLASPNPKDFGGLTNIAVVGERFSPGVRSGVVAIVFQYVAEQLHKRVEPIVRSDWHQADDWGYNYRQNRNAKNLSCHASGTAIDFNATKHPNGKANTFNAAQVKEIRKILVEVDNVVRWGGDFGGTKDEMHFEINADFIRVATVAKRLTAIASPYKEERLFMYLTRDEEYDLLKKVRELHSQLNPLEFTSHHGATKDNQYGHVLSIRKTLKRLEETFTSIQDAIKAIRPDSESDK